MPVMQTPTGPIEFSDPNNVPEVFVNGPFNVIDMGGLVQITFTTVRPSPDDLFKGSQVPEFRGTVVSRLLMPADWPAPLEKILKRRSHQGHQWVTLECAKGTNTQALSNSPQTARLCATLSSGDPSMTVKIDGVEPNIFPDVEDLDARDAGRNVEVFLDVSIEGNLTPVTVKLSYQQASDLATLLGPFRKE